MATHDPYDRAVTDPGFLDQVRAAHTGHWDVLDALWWELHPDDESPAGTPSPTARLRELQHRVFSRAGGTLEDREAHSALVAEIASEETAIRTAVAAASAEPEPVLAPMHDFAAPPAVEPAPSRGARALLVPVVAVVAALLVGGGLGAQLTNGDADAAPAHDPSPSATRTPSALAVFERPQQVDDIPPLALPQDFRPESLRLLTPPGGRASSMPRPASDAYAARDTSNRICLIAVSDATYASTCVAERVFASYGVQVHWSTAASPPLPGAEGTHGSFALMTTWRTDGTVTGHSGPLT